MEISKTGGTGGIDKNFSDIIQGNLSAHKGELFKPQLGGTAPAPIKTPLSPEKRISSFDRFCKSLGLNESDRKDTVSLFSSIAETIWKENTIQ